MFNFSQNASFLSENEIIEFLNQVSGGFKTPSDSFFDDCNQLLKPFIKQGVISFENEEDFHIKNPVVCNVLGCNQEFDTVFAYETHYNSLHRYLCGQCKKSLPTPHLLDLHLSEHHDSFFAVKSRRQPMYSCFIEECQHKSSTPEERKDHCIKFHKFPSNYRFDNFLTGGNSISSKSENNDMEIVDDDCNKLVLEENKKDHVGKNIVKNFTFGHLKTKTFDMKNMKKPPKKSINKGSALENDETFTELKESLPKQ